MKINEIEIGTRVSMSFIIDGKDIRIFGEVVPKDMMTELFGIWSDFEAAMIPACIVRVEDAKSLKDGIDYVADTLLAPKEWLTYLWEYVDGRKQDRLRATASMYLSQNPTNLSSRFDIIEIYAPEGLNTAHPQINHMEDAFQ